MSSVQLRDTKWIAVFGYCDPNTWDLARLEKQSRATSQVFGSQYPDTGIHFVFPL